MSLLCKVGLHEWQGDPFSDRRRVCVRCFESRPKRLLCHYGIHQWEGRCKCSGCNAQRDAGHKWKGCLCTQCRKQRDEQHEWVGCLCKTCKKSRDEQHDWQGCRCKRCGGFRDQEHRMRGCKCEQCYKTRDTEHEWAEFSCAVCQKDRYEMVAGAVICSREHVFETGVVSACVKSHVVDELMGSLSDEELKDRPVEEAIDVFRRMQEAFDASRPKRRLAVFLACRGFHWSRAEAEKLLGMASAYTVEERLASSVQYALEWRETPVYYVQIMEKKIAEAARGARGSWA